MKALGADKVKHFEGIRGGEKRYLYESYCCSKSYMEQRPCARGAREAPDHTIPFGHHTTIRTRPPWPSLTRVILTFFASCPTYALLDSDTRQPRGSQNFGKRRDLLSEAAV